MKAHCETLKPVTLVISLLAYVFFTGFPAHAEQAGNVPPAELVEKMKKGGFILYIRHAATDHSQSDTDLNDFSNCATQRNLSEQGKRETRDMKVAIGKLGIPIGKVFTSPYCRCVDTAKIAFGEYEVLDKMRATFFANEEETRDLAAFLRGQLATKPAPGTNTVLVGHTANLRDVTRVWPKPEGVTHVFEPLGNGQFLHLGRIEPTIWPSLAGN